MDQSPLVPPTLTQEPLTSEQPSDTISSETILNTNQEDTSAPAQLQVETTHVDTAAISSGAQNELPQQLQNQQSMEPPKSNVEDLKRSDEVAAPTSETDSSTTNTDPVLPALEQINNLDVTELTTQIMDMINQDDDEGDLTKTTLLKKNVELQEFMVKLIELLREKTNLSANLERQNTALTSQARSLRDVISITKDLLNIRNMEVEHLHVDMGAMEKCIKEERERHNMAVQRLSEAMSLNDKLKTEYLNQMELFGKLRDKYNEKVMILTKENQRLKNVVKVEALPEPVVPAPEDIIIHPNSVAPEETNGVV